MTQVQREKLQQLYWSTLWAIRKRRPPINVPASIRFVPPRAS